jgi:iron complex outermembrane recepter protein
MYPFQTHFNPGRLDSSLLRFSLACLLAATSAEGQVEQAQRDLSDDSATSQIFTLSPFEVSTEGDSLYLATNATSGTRLNMAIKDLPMPLSVITSEFITDTGAVDFKEALAYSAGVSLESFESGGGNSRGANDAYSGENSPSASAGGTSTEFTNSVFIRSFRTDTQQRAGFRVGGSVPNYGLVFGGLTDSVNTERLEVVKGPAALLYGVNVLGGVVNIIPKKPLGERFDKASLTVGSQGFRRATLEHDAPLIRELPIVGGKLDYRIAGSWDARGDWTDFYNRETRYGVVQLNYQHPKVRFLTEYQIGSLKLIGFGQQSIFDDLGGARSESVWVADADEFRTPWDEQYNWQRDGQLLEARGLPGFGTAGPEFRISGPDTLFKRDEWSIRQDIEVYPLERLTLKVSAVYSELDIEELSVSLASRNNNDRSISFKNSISNPIVIDEDLLEIFNNPAADPDNPLTPGDLTDRKLARYWWGQYPVNNVNEQVRAEAAYDFETHLPLGDRARHVLLAGVHSIKDNVEHVARRSTASEIAMMQNRQAVYSQRSIYDQSVIRYAGEPLAYPGRITDLVVNRENAVELVPSLSGIQETTIWQKGMYAIYQGFFMDEKLYALVGFRRDRLQVLEQEYGVNVRNKVTKYAPNPALPFITIDINTPLIEGLTEDFAREEYNFDEALNHDSWSYALRYTINDEWSVFALTSQGVFPNTGQRDGNDEPIEPETTQSYEIGVKFELMDKKISGSFSVFRMNRENAVWYWNQAPRPADFASNKEPAFVRGVDFDPSKVEDGTQPISYGVNVAYFNLDWFPKNADGTPRFTDANGNQFPGIALVDIGGDPKVFLKYEDLDTAGYPLNPEVKWRTVIEEAFSDLVAGRDDLTPMFFNKLGQGNSPSNNRGSNVTFEDEATGFEFNVIVSPTDNWQLLFNFSHIERKVVGPFNIALPVNYTTGRQYATEYDIWVAALGREAFADPKDPSTLNGGGIDGTSLYFGPEETASLWSMYRIAEGPLEGLRVGLGAVYTGSAMTSIAVGGDSIAANRFRTPDTEARIVFNGSLQYSWEWRRVTLTAQLNVNNLLNNTYGLTTVQYYDDVNNREEMRRTELYYAPRSYRMSLTMSF